jgi:hypothetical protein
VSEGDWYDARSRSVEILGQILYDHVARTLTDKTSPLVELREVVAAAGID